MGQNVRPGGCFALTNPLTHRPKHTGGVMKPFACLLMVAILAISAVAQDDLKFRYPLPSDNQITKKTVAFAKDSTGDLLVDVYRPAQAKGKIPILLLLNGVGRKLGGGLFREQPQYAGWGRAATSAGM